MREGLCDSTSAQPLHSFHIVGNGTTSIHISKRCLFTGDRTMSSRNNPRGNGDDLQKAQAAACVYRLCKRPEIVLN